MENKPLKVILCVNNFLPVIGGKQFVVYYLAGALQKLGHKVCIVGPGLGSRHYKFAFPIYGFPYHGISKLEKKFGLFGLVTKLHELIRFLVLRITVNRFGCDVIHAHTTYPDGFSAVRLSKKMSIPVIITPHGEDIQIIPELNFGKMLIPKLNSRIKYSIDGACVLTAISKNIYSALLDANASKEKIKMIPNGVDIERFSKFIDKDIRDWLGAPQDAKIIVTVGQYHPRKGHDILIRAMSSVVMQNPQARLVIIGQSDKLLEQLIDELNLREFVILTGQIKSHSILQTKKASNLPEDQVDLLAAILQNSHMYVSASIGEDSEGLSLAVLEAMAAALPVVASDISGNKDVVIDGENGFLVTPGSIEHLSQAISKLLSDDDMQKKMGLNSKSIVSRYDWLEIARQYESVYRNAKKII